MKKRISLGLLVVGGGLIVVGAAGFGLMYSKLTDDNEKITYYEAQKNHYLSDSQWQEYYALLSERDVLAGRIPWAIGAIIIGIIFIISGVVLKIRPTSAK